VSIANAGEGSSLGQLAYFMDTSLDNRNLRSQKMEKPKIVSHGEWRQARKQLLAKGKELTHLRDALSAGRRDFTKGRDEAGLAHPTDWLHRHDEYHD
jgi:predicted dithiol-disulfide oxidoreductase (DUF899 family)